MPDLNDLESIYFAALNHPPAERAAFLTAACRDDRQLRGAVERLLAVEPRVGGFLDPSGTLSVRDPQAVGDTVETHLPPLGEGGVTLGGRYRLMEVIGEGGMGLVYRSEQTDPVRRAVAVKVLKAGMDGRAVLARFEAERQALAIMDHPNIAKVFDAGSTPDGRPYFVLELVRGVPITQFCDANRLTPQQRLELFVAVCQAIQHAHQKGVIHRDIKPSNVLVALYDDKAVPKVIDFGVAKATGSQLAEGNTPTAAGVLVGTPEYMSPEQASLNTPYVDTRTDVYALGVLLYELLTGTTPVDRRSLGRVSLLEILRRVREEDTPRPSVRLSTLPALSQVAADRGTEPTRLVGLYATELDWIVLKALEKDRDRRYDSATGLAADVLRHLAGEPVLAFPPTTGYRLRKFVRRHRRAVAVGAIVLAAVFGGAAVSVWQAVRATAAESRARANEGRAVAAGERATEEAAVARALADFLQNDLLMQANLRHQDPAAGRTRDLTTRQLLDRAAGRIDGRFPNQERVEAKIRYTIGGAYLALGEYQAAQDQMERAVALLTDKLPPDHPELLHAVGGLGRAYQVRGQLALAEPLLVCVVVGLRRQRPEDDVDLLIATRNLAGVYAGRGRFEEAEGLFVRSLDGLREKLGEKDHSTLVAHHGLADLYRLQRRFPEADRLLTRLATLSRDELGADHPDDVSLAFQLASLRRDQGRLAEAEQLFDKARDRRHQLLGPDHPETLVAVLHYAQVLSTRGRLDAAEPLLRETLATLKSKLGDDAPPTVTATNSLGVLHLRRNRPADALPLLKTVVERRRSEPGPDHPDTLDAVRNLAVAHFLTGREAEALRLFREAAEGLERRGFRHPNPTGIWENVTGALDRAGRTAEANEWRRKWAAAVRDGLAPRSPQYAASLAVSGNRLLDRQQWAVAEATLRESLTVWEEVAPDDWRTAHTKSLLGQALIVQGKYADAEPHLLAGYTRMKEREKANPKRDARLAEAIDRLIELYTATDRPREVRSWLAERARYRETLPPPRKE